MFDDRPNAMASRAPVTNSSEWTFQEPRLTTVEMVAWHTVNLACRGTLNQHVAYWWRYCGYALSVLLAKAEYPLETQVRFLNFFVSSIAPSLGVAQEKGAEKWKSFMTDDHNPVELSWDWNTGHNAPTVRFSIEPVGEQAGTPQDLYNEHASIEFLATVSKEIPERQMLWFRHFDGYFAAGPAQDARLGHDSRIFWAFDLGERDAAAKAYFFPGYRANSTGKTTFEVISDAIKTAPSCNPSMLTGLGVFREYVKEQFVPLEMDMLAIDLVEPTKSRLKIYFRSRATSFQSVRGTMTLGGRLASDDISTGLDNLRHLWDRLFDQRGVPDTSPLAPRNHRTAGILYYVELSLRSMEPKVKVYMPVRHYSRSDWQIMCSVADYMDSVATGVASTSQQHQLRYCAAISNIFEQDELKHQKGKQTYVACSIQPGGALRVVSYINPRISHVLED